MTDYRRAYRTGAAWFFTLNLAERRGNRLLNRWRRMTRSMRFLRQHILRGLVSA